MLEAEEMEAEAEGFLGLREPSWSAYQVPGQSEL